jgi:nucleoside-triphosphatase
LIYILNDIQERRLPSSDTMINDIKIGITGLPGSGKTYTLLRVIDMLKEEELTIGGMIDEPISDGRHKTGFTVKNILTGESQIFASQEIESKIMIGKIGVDLSKFEEVSITAIKDACEKCDIIVIDEVGKVEVESQAFIDAVKDALDINKPMILTLHKKSRNPLLQDIRRRDDVRILEVTPTNRNLLPYKIIRLMNGENV